MITHTLSSGGNSVDELNIEAIARMNNNIRKMYS